MERKLISTKFEKAFFRNGVTRTLTTACGVDLDHPANQIEELHFTGHRIVEHSVTPCSQRLQGRRVNFKIKAVKFTRNCSRNVFQRP
jgi:hypothetical protein